MSFLSKAFKAVGSIFKKKEGGTWAGNLIRAVVGKKNPSVNASDSPAPVQQVLDRVASDGGNAPLFDFSNLIKLPTLSVDTGQNTNSILKIGIAAVVVIALGRLFFGGKSAHHAG